MRQLLLSIPDEMYDFISSKPYVPYDGYLEKKFNHSIKLAFKDSIALPKEHGRLIDADALLDKLDSIFHSIGNKSKECLTWNTAVCAIHQAPVVVAANDKKQELKDEILNEYLIEVVKNDEKCNMCAFKHTNNVCFFASECIKNNHQYFREEK